jgi:hypothetical protein
MKLSRDKNGNKTVVVESVDFEFNESRGFSIQTNGNLPRTHKMDQHSFDQSVAMSEVRSYVAKYGTQSQKFKLGV